MEIIIPYLVREKNKFFVNGGNKTKKKTPAGAFFRFYRIMR